MDERLLRPRSDSEIDRAIDRVVERLAAGDLVVLPTETVYGLGAVADDEGARRRLQEAKRRPPDRPFPVVHAHRRSALAALDRPTPAARRLARRYWPGPLTLVGDAPGGGRLGVRVPGQPWTREVLRRLGRPVLLPSANRSGEPPPTTAEAALAALDDAAALVLDAGPSPLGVPSTVVLATRSRLEVRRAGVLTLADVMRVAVRRLLLVCSGNTCRSPMAAALLRAALARRLGVAVDALGAVGFRVASAGVAALPGAPASPAARSVMARRGLDISRHGARPVTPALLADSDRVLCMTESQCHAVRAMAPPGLDVGLLDPAGLDVPDPFGADESGYDACARRLEALVESVAEQEVDK